MSKADKRILITISAFILLIIVSVFVGLHITKTNLTNAAIDYLCEKYGAREEEFELIDYERSKYFLNDDAIPSIERGNYKWEFKYNNRSFFVNKIDGKYYDDYQLADIEYLCVDWFKKNIDNSICCIDIDSYLIYEYQIEKNNNYLVFNDKNIEELLNSKHARPLNTVYYTSVNKKNKNDELKNKTKHLLPNTGISVFQPIYGDWQIKEQKTKDHIIEIYCINQSNE